MKRWAVLLGWTGLMALLVSCERPSGEAGSGGGSRGPSGKIVVDGSSTVLPISEAVAEEFQKQYPDASPVVGKSGTGGGFKKFANGEIDITGASRPIREVEDEACRKNGIEYIEIPIAYDALAVVVNPKNTWCDHLTVKELKKLWEPAATGKITRWSQVRPDFPDRPLVLFGAGVDSGTFDYFTAAIVGEERSSRSDYSSSEDDNILVQGVANNENALGYFGMAYYLQNKDKLKAVAIDDENPNNGDGPILPSEETVVNGTYQPLSRPLFIYVNVKSLEKPQVRVFVKVYIEQAAQLAKEVGYVPLSPQMYELAKQRLEKRITGSVFGAHGSQVGVKLEDLYKMEEAAEGGR
ncbi:MAG: PstS family phosphate ABC transporter substrate-binding protein [Fimbriimonadales bacterium]|nr:PstS family phosphate ABC transporter substrate-binding protein [Fimbriimonadales bacterium]